jgi:hypothetical protein
MCLKKYTLAVESNEKQGQTLNFKPLTQIVVVMVSGSKIITTKNAFN